MHQNDAVAWAQDFCFKLEREWERLAFSSGLIARHRVQQLAAVRAVGRVQLAIAEIFSRPSGLRVLRKPELAIQFDSLSADESQPSGYGS